MLPILSMITSLASGWLSNKKAKGEAVHNEKLNQIKNKHKWETIVAQQMTGTWKDEFFVLLFSFPLITMFISPYVDMIMRWKNGGAYIEGELLLASQSALIALANAPLWYSTILGVMIGATFGVKSVTRGILQLRK